MMQSYELGKRGEEIVAEFYKGRGFSIVARNYRVGYKEIDIIVETESRICFVEVKTRRWCCVQAAELSVNGKKQSFLIQAAHYYVKKYKVTKSICFDVVCVIFFSDGRYCLHHIPSAFSPFGG